MYNFLNQNIVIFRGKYLIYLIQSKIENTMYVRIELKHS